MTAAQFERLGQTRPAALVVDAAGAPPGSVRGMSRVAVCALQEAQRWLSEPVSRELPDPAAIPEIARRLRDAGARSVCVLGVKGPDGRRVDWLESEHARGWLAMAASSRRADATQYAEQLAAALGRGFVAADAIVIATMACSGEGDGFITDPALLPQLSWGEVPRFAAASVAAAKRPLGLYPIVDSAQRLQEVLDAGVATVQLRIKTPEAPDAAWHAMLRHQVQRSIDACMAAGAELFVNDHWQLAAELGASGVHLGQEDLLALGEQGRSALLASGLALGVSSHSLWELCRALALAPRYIACGPVWPTVTKDMPWRPQGLDNLAWWCRMAQAPVVAIGGVLQPQQVREAARCGADGVCIVRGLGDDPRQVVPALQAALAAGRGEYLVMPPQPAWPHPSLREEG